MKNVPKNSILRFFCFLFSQYHFHSNDNFGIKWIEEMRQKVQNGKKDIFGMLPKELRKKYSQKDILEIFLASSEIDFDLEKQHIADQELFHFERSDLFQDNRVRGLFEEGIQRMHTSIDPMHGWSHIRRLLQYADLIWQKLPVVKRPDWGDIIMAIAWHDAARVDKLGPADDDWVWLKKIPFGQDFSIIYTALRDAPRSATLFKRAAKHYRIPKKKQIDFISAITMTTNGNKKGKKRRTKKSILPILISDLDVLDLMSIGRMEDFFENARNEILIDKKFTDSFLNAIFHFKASNWEKLVFLLESKYFLDIIKNFSISYIEKFYPEEYSFFIKADEDLRKTVYKNKKN